MAEMIIRMTMSTALYVLITAVLWRFWNKREHSLQLKIAIGIIFGLCSIASTHFGVAYTEMVLNVRDIGPLAAGLFFNPLSGIISGLIGGIERYIAGTYWGVGKLTTTACSVSTCLAGLLSACLYKFLYKGQRPPATQAFYIGAVMEVFHMYAVIFTNRNSIEIAHYVVKKCSIPMVIFNGLGIFACSLYLQFYQNDFKDVFRIPKKEETPVMHRFHRWLLVVTFTTFAFNFITDYNYLTRSFYQNTRENIYALSSDCQLVYYDLAGNDREQYRKTAPYVVSTLDDNAELLVFDRDRNVITSYNGLGYIDFTITPEDYALFESHVGTGIFRAEPAFFEGEDSLCLVEKLDENTYQMVGWRYASIWESFENQMYEDFLSDILMFTALYLLIAVLVDEVVVKSLKSVIDSLHRIIDGDLDEVVSVRDSLEFSTLSDEINKTVTSLKGYVAESQKRMKQELKLAAFIQESALPHVFEYPRKDFEIYALMDPAREIGGDFYDFFFTNVNQLTLVIADVSGKGIPAALFMMRAKTAIVNAARVGKSPSEVLYEVNNILCEGNSAEMFVTVWIGMIDLETGVMKCANAGHEYPVIYRAGRDYSLYKDRHGLVLAAMENSRAKEYTIQFYPGDRLFVYTDGAPEAINTAFEQYGTGRLVDKLNTLRDASEEETLNEVRRDISVFSKDTEQFDDITLMGFKYQPHIDGSTDA